MPQTIYGGQTGAETLRAGSVLTVTLVVGTGATVFRSIGGAAFTGEPALTATTTYGPYENDQTFKVCPFSGATVTMDVSASPGAQPNDAQAAALAALVSGAGSAVVTGLDTLASRVQLAHWPCGDSATTLGDAVGKGPSIAVAGTTTGALGTAGWFTHDAAGNTLQLKAIPYIDGLINMTTDGAILIGCDLFLTGWPSAGTEYLWALHRSAESTTGGLALTISNSAAGRFSVQYKPNGGSQNEVTGFAPGTYLNVRNSLLVEAIVNTARAELTTHFFHNGRLERSNVWPLATPPAADAACGLNFSGYGATPTAKVGSGGSTGARVQNLLVGRHNGKDRNLAGRLARDMYANAALPSWLTRI